MGNKGAYIRDDEFKFQYSSTDLSVQTLVHCFSHCICNERGKVNSSLLCDA